MRLTSTTNRFTFVFMLDKVKQCEKSLTGNAKRVCVRVRAWQRDYMKNKIKSKIENQCGKSVRACARV